MDEIAANEGDSASLVAQEFFLVTITAEQLARIPKWYRALLVASSFVTNEVLCLQRLLILTLNAGKACGNIEPTKAIYIANLGLLNRILSGKAIEFLRLVDQFGERTSSAEDALSRKLRNSFRLLKPLRKAAAYKLATAMRNAISHHYSLDDFERFATTAGVERTSMWLGEMEGNSSYFLGEELTNVGLFAEVGDAEVAVGDWVDWSREASGLISKVNAEIAIAIAEAFIPELGYEQRKVLLSASLFANVEETAVPLLWHPFRAVDL